MIIEGQTFLGFLLFIALGAYVYSRIPKRKSKKRKKKKQNIWSNFWVDFFDAFPRTYDATKCKIEMSNDVMHRIWEVLQETHRVRCVK